MREKFVVLFWFCVMLSFSSAKAKEKDSSLELVGWKSSHAEESLVFKKRTFEDNGEIRFDGFPKLTAKLSLAVVNAQKFYHQLDGGDDGSSRVVSVSMKSWPSGSGVLRNWFFKITFSHAPSSYSSGGTGIPDFSVFLDCYGNVLPRREASEKK